MKVTKGTTPIEHYLEAVYPVTVYRAPEGGYVAEIEDLPGCITEGETLEEAFQRIEDARRAWIEVQYEDGAEIPLPRTDEQYSGKFLLRIPKALHRQLAEQAKREGVSLNQYVATLLATKAIVKDLVSQIAETLKAQQADRAAVLGPHALHYQFSAEAVSQRRPIAGDKVRIA